MTDLEKLKAEHNLYKETLKKIKAGMPNNAYEDTDAVSDWMFDMRGLFEDLGSLDEEGE